MNYQKSWDDLTEDEQYDIAKGLPRYLRPKVDPLHRCIYFTDSEQEQTIKKVWEAHRREKLLFKETYAEYLKSPEWKVKRNAVLVRDGHRCRLCGNTATEVHHLTYDRKYNESLYDLVAVCRECHQAVHVLR